MAAPTPADIEAVRLLVGDPAGPTQALADAQITTLLTANGLDRYAAAADCADALAALYAKRVDTHVGILSASDGQLSRQYRELAASLRKRGATSRAGRAVPWASLMDNPPPPLFGRQSETREELC